MTTQENARACSLRASASFKIVAGILAVLAAAGVAAWIYQLANGLGVTGMNNGSSWGLYIASFMFFVGLSAGGLIVASSASVFHVAKFKQVALPAVILSTVCICCAGMFVLIDLGGIQRIWRIVTGPNPTSPLLWDICVITCYLIVNLLYLYFMVSKKADPRKIAVISRFALPIAILVHSVTAWIFGLQMAREGWYSAIMAPIFVASAMDSGLALLLIVLIALNVTKVFKTGPALIASLGGLLATCIAVDAFFIGCELLTVVYPGTAMGNAVLAEMFSGHGAVLLVRNHHRTACAVLHHGVSEEPGTHGSGCLCECLRCRRRVLQTRVAAVHVVPSSECGRSAGNHFDRAPQPTLRASTSGRWWGRIRPPGLRLRWLQVSCR